MNQPKLTLIAIALSAVAWAQGPPKDTITVDLPFDVIAGESTIAAGEHTFRQVSASGGAASRVMLINEDGDSIQATVITNPVLQRPTPSDTTVVIQRIGTNHYLDKIWVAGKNTGYQIPIPEDARSSSQEASGTYSLNANYSQQATQVAQAKPTPQPAPAPAPAPAKDPSPTQAEPVAPQPPPQPAPEREQQVAQAKPAPQQPAPQQPEPQQDTQPQQETAQAQTAPQQEVLPATSLNWLEGAASGVVLISLGTLLFGLRRVFAR